MKFSNLTLFTLATLIVASTSPSEAYKAIKSIISSHEEKLNHVISKRQVPTDAKSYIVSFPGASIFDISQHLQSIDSLVSGKSDQGITADFDVTESDSDPTIVGVAAVLGDDIIKAVQDLPFALVETDGKMYLWDTLQRNSEGIVYCDQLPGFGEPNFDPFYNDDLINEMSPTSGTIRLDPMEKPAPVNVITTEIVEVKSMEGQKGVTTVTRTITYTSTLSECKNGREWVVFEGDMGNCSMRFYGFGDVFLPSLC